MYRGLRDLAVHEALPCARRIAAACREVTPMGLDGGEPVIQLDDGGVALLAEWAGLCTHFLVEKRPDNAIVLHPVSRDEADLWRSGLFRQVADGFAHPASMKRVKKDKL